MDEQVQQMRDAVLEATEVALEAQLRAVRSLRKEGAKSGPKRDRPRRSDMSQIDMALDILRSSEPLHIGALIEQIHQRFGAQVDRESLVSALSKRVARQDRFCRVGRNIFGVIDTLVRTDVDRGQGKE